MGARSREAGDNTLHSRPNTGSLWGFSCYSCWLGCRKHSSHNKGIDSWEEASEIGLKWQ